ncbi:MAG: TonB-dependent receptor [Cyclobacteriaceae bacterium]|nr:TonB-dependent receptor [Cyclobacteriaceae bacterium]MCH8515937.1 TonB-dependent receptor [Cyclobacteriaceae bacterium]
MKTKLSHLLPLLCFFVSTILHAQNTPPLQPSDPDWTIEMQEVSVEARRAIKTIERKGPIDGPIIYSGKKNEVIIVSSLDADLSINNPRQVFAKVPGVHIWENDGTGIQLGIATRGLNPNRSWEFNVRQNGYDISSEVFGYPEAYYTPPMEAVETIELLRGSSALQFGPQFGGLLNFKIKEAPVDREFMLETQQTAGSYGLFNSFNAIGGTKGKFSYYAFYHTRSADGWRDNSRFQVNTGYINLNYAFSDRLKLSFDFTSMSYEKQQAGGLSDEMFRDNARQSNRERNWFSTPWNVGSLTLDYAINDRTDLNIRTFGVLAERSSVGFLAGPNVEDVINPLTNDFANRQVDRDFYRNAGTEARVLHRYDLLNNESALSVGMRAYVGNTLRQQGGIGTTGRTMDFSIARMQENGQEFARDLDFFTYNYAVFAENLFKVTDRLSITPGVRYEVIQNRLDGAFGVNNPVTDRNLDRGFFLFGTGVEFKTSETTNIYANYSQAFRPVTMAELTPVATLEDVDANLNDQTGFNFDLGYRGSFKNYINFDLGYFYMNYGNRIGVITDDRGLPFRTNVGSSISQGFESLIEFEPLKALKMNPRFGNINLFASTAFIDATYTSWNNPAALTNPELDFTGNRVENAPEFIHRFGLTYAYKTFSATTQVSSIGSVFTDANNTVIPNANATNGKIDGYNLVDIAFTYAFSKKYNLRFGANNVFDTDYATRRAGGYPGPGLLPGEGRTFFVGLGGIF